MSVGTTHQPTNRTPKPIPQNPNPKLQTPNPKHTRYFTHLIPYDAKKGANLTFACGSLEIFH